MIISAAQQGSKEWHKARAGVITASMFRVAREKLKTGQNKGQPSKAARQYAFRLAIERISKQPLDEGFETWQMARGRELEPLARAAHEVHAGLVVDPCGFVTDDDGIFGASADGLIGDDGGAEYKCLISPESLMDTLLGDDLSDYLDQVQGGMWITGRAWWDFCVYCPALEAIGAALTRWRVPRDNEYIESLQADLIEFNRLVGQFETTLRSRQ